MNIIIDSNILISALIKDSMTREILFYAPLNFIIPEYGLTEIKKYEKEICKKTKISPYELKELINILLKKITIVRTSQISLFEKKAREIMHKIDKEDVMFIAAALYYGCPIWSDDKHFQKQKEIVTFKTKEILQILKLK